MPTDNAYSAGSNEKPEEGWMDKQALVGAMAPLESVLLQCRSGFEKDCAAEAVASTAAAGISAHCRAAPGSAYVELRSDDGDRLADWYARTEFKRLAFPRQWCGVLRHLADLPRSNRVAPIIGALRCFPGPYAEVWLEYPDSNDGKALSTFCRKFATPLKNTLRADGFLESKQTETGALRLHLFFEDSGSVFLGFSHPHNASPWPMGIPRLKMPATAPSRSTLKLEEAFWAFLTARDRTQRLAPGMSAVDLGAAPGGWTWQLVRRNLRVTAVDNGPLDAALCDSGLVDQKRVDGFGYRPQNPVDWLVCDMVEQPHRVTRLVAQWLSQGLCRETIFNLKLPMKQRFKAVSECITLLTHARGRHAGKWEWGCKQLYHDREEVTVHVRRV